MKIFKELLKWMGPRMCHMEKIQEKIREFLVEELIDDFINEVPEVRNLNFEIFTEIFKKFGPFFKDEFQVILGDFFLQVLKKDKFDFEFSKSVFDCVSVLLKQSDVLLFMYVNYDLEMQCKNITNELLVILTKSIQTVTQNDSDFVVYKRNKAVKIISEILRELDSIRESLLLDSQQDSRQSSFSKLLEGLDDDSYTKMLYQKMKSYQLFIQEFNQNPKSAKKNLSLIQDYFP